MNSYDQAALQAVRDYYKAHGKYPERVEVTAEYRTKMTCTHFECPELPGPTNFTPLDSTGLRTPVVTRVPVLPLGSGDIVFRSVLVRNTYADLEQAQCATYEQFHQLGAKLARKGLLILEPREKWGLQGEERYFSQIEAWIFGEERIFAELEANPLKGE